MIGELISTVGLYVIDPSRAFLWGLIALLGIWLSTFTLQVPCHRQLSQQYHEKIVQRLVLTNWIRTLLWTFRAGLVLYLFVL